MQEARRYRSAAVVSPHYLASGTGVQVLAAGGNAIDAAVAANLTLGVVAPYLCGYGGDLFALVWDGRLHGYASAGRSGASATIDSVRTSVPKPAGMPVFGPHTVTVPGAVLGWFELLERFGTRPFAELSRPAHRYAQEGFALTARGRAAFEMVRALHADDPWSRELLDTYSQDRTGGESTVVQPGLAATIETLADDGPASFYSGAIGEAIAETVHRYGGTLTAADMSAHRSLWPEPLTAEFAGYEVCELPPPTQGVTALQALAIADRLDIHNASPTRDHLLVEAAKLALMDRDDHVADPAAMSVAAADLLAARHIEKLSRTIDVSHALEPPVRPGPDGGTAYLCAVDGDGLAVSLIQSNFAAIGAGIHVPHWGINLQNRGSSFRLDAAHVNALAPNKLPMHTLIPSMVLRDAAPWLVFGTMGGHGQAQTHLQILTRLLVDEEELQAAVSAPRWALDPNHWTLAAEKRFSERWREEMSRRGHRLVSSRSFDDAMGHAHAIRLDHQSLAAATDPRAEGAALGL